MDTKHGELYSFPRLFPKMPAYVPMIGINHCHSNYCNIRKKSQITVLAYVIKGQGTIHMNSMTFHPKEGDMFILRRGTEHEVVADPEQSEFWTYLWYNIRGPWILDMLKAYQLHTTVWVPDVPMEALFRKGFQLMSQSEQPMSEQIQTDLQLICAEIILTLHNLLRRSRTPLSPQVHEIKQFLDNHLNHAFDSGELCKAMALSFKQINRVFKKEVGTTVYNYVLSQKIDLAKILLEDTDQTVVEIAYHLGYADSHYFSNIFKKKTGFTPTAYRASMK